MNLSNKKRSLGQFFTKNEFWLKQHIVDFIKHTRTTIVFDPFAGEGHLLNAVKELGFDKSIGLDIDHSLCWEHNDSLLNIPKIQDSIIITNPPYLTNYSAKRQGIYANVEKYFSGKYDDIYLLAIEKCLVNDFGIMIVPETFIGSKFPKNRLISITIVEDILFSDTETPICIICFDNKIKSLDKINIYKNETLLGDLLFYENLRKKPTKLHEIKFNSLGGQIALRAVDTTNHLNPIRFMKPQDMNYDLSTIKASSRLITLIEVGFTDTALIEKIIDFSNEILLEFRKSTHDILLSPFKGNKKNGERRRRLDYLTARAILEDAHDMALSSFKLL